MHLICTDNAHLTYMPRVPIWNGWHGTLIGVKPEVSVPGSPSTSKQTGSYHRQLKQRQVKVEITGPHQTEW